MKKIESNPYISIGEAAKIFGVNPQTLRRWEKIGRIKFDLLPSGHRRIKRDIILELQKSMHVKE